MFAGVVYDTLERCFNVAIILLDIHTTYGYIVRVVFYVGDIKVTEVVLTFFICNPYRTHVRP